VLFFELGNKEREDCPHGSSQNLVGGITCHKSGAHLTNEATEAQRPVAKRRVLIPQRFLSTLHRPDSVLEIGWGIGQAPSLVPWKETVPSSWKETVNKSGHR